MASRSRCWSAASRRGWSSRRSPRSRPARRRHTRVSAQPLLATRQLGLDIGGATIVADVSLEVAPGEFLGVIGPNGAGKTSLFNLLSGLRRATSGRVVLEGVDVTDAAPYRRAKLGDRKSVRVGKRGRT